MVVNEQTLPITAADTLAAHLGWHLDSVVHAKPGQQWNGETDLDFGTDRWPNFQHVDDAK